MKIISKNNIISVLLASGCGIITGHLFLSLYGVVSSYLADIRAIEWIKVFPKSIHPLSFWLYCFIFEIIVIGIIIIIVGCIIGAFFKINKILASITSFICFELTKAFYHYRLWNEFSLVNTPIIYYLLISVIAVCLFWFSFYLGGVIRKKER